MIELKNGPTLPDDVVALALDLEKRGFQLLRVGDDSLRVSAIEDDVAPLTSSDRAAISLWKQHLLTLVDYCTDK